MAKRIKVRLTAESIDEAIKEVNDCKERVRVLATELGEALVEEGIFIAKTWIIAYNAVETGELLDSIEGYFDPTTGRGLIKTDSDHAAFVEFGTGVRGEEHQGESPDKPSGWIYDQNEHGHNGWYYGRGHRRWTKGMPPRPFMYQTFTELCQKASEIARAKYHD